MKVRIFVLTAVLGISTAALYSQAFVRGRVAEAGTGNPIPGVHVVPEPGSGTATGTGGDYSLRTVAGQVIITFRFVGYKAERKTVNLAVNDTLVLDISMEPDITTLNEIVVSAGRTEQRLSELTVSMSVIKPYIIGRNHFISADELLNRTPGIEILDGQASIRGGSGYSYGAGSRVLALIDGLPAMSADAGNIKWHALPLENISRIEVIKGASSVLYGSSALNGIVNFITREPDENPYTSVTASAAVYGNPSSREWKWWDTPRTTFSASMTHSAIYGRNSVGVGLKILDDNGYRALNEERYSRVNIRLKRASSVKSGLYYGVNLITTATSKRDFLLWEDASTGALKQNPETAMPFRGTSISVDPFFVAGGNGKGEHKAGMRLMSNLNRMPEDENNNSDSHSIYSEYQYSSGRRGLFAIVAGTTQTLSIINSRFYGDHSGFNVAGYSQFEAYPLEWLRGVAGFRIEQYVLDGETSRPVPIFRAGLNATLGRATYLRASIGQGYRYPSVAEKHAYTTVGSIKILPNPEIRPESGWSSEAGLRQGFSVYNMSGQADLALFYSQNSNMIEYVFGYWYDIMAEEYTYGFRPTNIENSRVYGAEAELLLSFTNGKAITTLTAGYTFMYPVEFNGVTGRNTGKYLKFRRKNAAELGLSTSFGRLEAGFNMAVKSKILDIDNVFVNPLSRETILPGFYDYWLEHNSGHFVADVFVSYRMGQPWQVSAGIKNLTNTEYMGRPGDIMPHRQFSLQVTGRF